MRECNLKERREDIIISAIASGKPFASLPDLSLVRRGGLNINDVEAKNQQRVYEDAVIHLKLEFYHDAYMLAETEKEKADIIELLANITLTKYNKN